MKPAAQASLASIRCVARGLRSVSRQTAVAGCRLCWRPARELKNTFCITNRNYAFLSHHIGDMENYETLQILRAGHRAFRAALPGEAGSALPTTCIPTILPRAMPCSARTRRACEAVGVQHHHAHIAACMAEHGLDGSQPVIGVAFDGTGYGDDGAIWGGEFLRRRLSRTTSARLHLEYFPLARRRRRHQASCPHRAGFALVAGHGLG